MRSASSCGAVGSRAKDDRHRPGTRATSARRAMEAAEANPFVVPYSLRQRYRKLTEAVNAATPTYVP
jgi:hypothetical protein